MDVWQDELDGGRGKEDKIVVDSPGVADGGVVVDKFM